MRGDMLLAGLTLLIVLAAAPAAATKIEFVWQANGSKSITVLPGQEVVLEGRVIAEGDQFYGIGVSALAPIALLLATDFEVCPNGCSPRGPAGLGAVVLNHQTDRDTVALPFEPVAGLSGSFAALAVTPQSADFVLFELTFQVVGIGSGEVLPYYRLGVGGIADVDTGYFLPPADGADFASGITLTVIPEPATAMLLGAGLIFLVGRQRRSG
jgi:hypothetical protein